jgi:hypothetical protein
LPAVLRPHGRRASTTAEYSPRDHPAQHADQDAHHLERAFGHRFPRCQMTRAAVVSTTAPAAMIHGAVPVLARVAVTCSRTFPEALPGALYLFLELPRLVTLATGGSLGTGGAAFRSRPWPATAAKPAMASKAAPAISAAPRAASRPSSCSTSPGGS